MHGSRGSNLRRKRPDHNVFAFELRCGAKHSQFAGDYRTGCGDPTLRVRVEHKKIAPEQSAGAIPFDALLRTHCIPRRPAADLDAGQRVSRLTRRSTARTRSWAFADVLLAWAPLAGHRLTCGNASAGRWLDRRCAVSPCSASSRARNSARADAPGVGAARKTSSRLLVRALRRQS